MATQKKYVTLSKLSTFLDNLRNTFATREHNHNSIYYTESEIDSKIADLNTAIDGKAASSHIHDERYYTETEIDAKVDTLNSTISGKADVSHTHTISNVTNLQSSLDSKTATSVIPNNSGEVKTKYRIGQKGYTSGATWYYKICDLPNNNSGNYASAIISGRIGGWVSGNMSYINSLIWNRNTPGIALMDIAGTATSMSSIWNIADLVLYTNGTSATAANTASLYVRCYGYFTFDLDLELFQSEASITYDGSYITTTPSGTLAAQSSTTTKRVEIVNGQLMVNGTALLTTTGNAASATKATKDASGNVITSTYETKTDATSKLAEAKADLDSHTSNTTVHITSTERTNWNAAKTHADSAHAPSNAEKNQNAFSNIVVGSTTVAADSATDTLTLAGSNVTLTPDAANDKITFSVADGSTSTKGILQLTDSTSSTSTTTAATPKSVKLAYDLAATAYDAADLAQSTADGKANASHTHTIANVTNLQSSLNAKQATVTGGASTITSSNLTTDRVLVSNSSGKVAVSDVTSTELGYLSGITNDIQAQLDGKASSAHTHKYAGSSSAGGAATSANKLNTNAGDSNTPVYFSNGVPVACTSLDLNTTGSSASCTGNAATATKATQDGSGNVITDTYMTQTDPTGTGSISIGRKSGTDVGSNSVALGRNVEASTFRSIAIGDAVTSSGNAAVAMGANSTSEGACSFALGNWVTSSGSTSVATGYFTNASAWASTAMGDSSTASGKGSTAIGTECEASGKHSTAMGYCAKASAPESVAIGGTVANFTAAPEATGEGAVAIGPGTISSNYYSTAIGGGTTASGQGSVALGYKTVASGAASTAMCNATIAAGGQSTAMGYNTAASGTCSTAMCYSTTALNYQTVTGWYNNLSNATPNTSVSGTGSGSAFVIGNGTSSSGSNAFRVNYSGQTYGKSAYTTNGCDYAEYFEWLDSNPDNEDRRGYFVTLDGEKIKIAEPGDYILGIISGHPAVIGNGDEDWMGRYILDDFGEFIYEDYEYETEEPEEVIDEETGEVTIQMKTVKRTCKKYKENPDYDPSIAYVQREDRPEWDAVGMVGVLSVRDDGTCQVNGYCKVAAGGTATASDSGYRVIKRVNDNIVKVIFR